MFFHQSITRYLSGATKNSLAQPLNRWWTFVSLLRKSLFCNLKCKDYLGDILHLNEKARHFSFRCSYTGGFELTVIANLISIGITNPSSFL